MIINFKFVVADLKKEVVNVKYSSVWKIESAQHFCKRWCWSPKHLIKNVFKLRILFYLNFLNFDTVYLGFGKERLFLSPHSWIYVLGLYYHSQNLQKIGSNMNVWGVQKTPICFNLNSTLLYQVDVRDLEKFLNLNYFCSIRSMGQETSVFAQMFEHLNVWQTLHFWRFALPQT